MLALGDAPDGRAPIHSARQAKAASKKKPKSKNVLTTVAQCRKTTFGPYNKMMGSLEVAAKTGEGVLNEARTARKHRF